VGISWEYIICPHKLCKLWHFGKWHLALDRDIALYKSWHSANWHLASFRHLRKWRIFSHDGNWKFDTSARFSFAVSEKRGKKRACWKVPHENLVGGIPTPLKNDGVKVSWDDYSIPLTVSWKVLKFQMESHNPFHGSIIDYYIPLYPIKNPNDIPIWWESHNPFHRSIISHYIPLKSLYVITSMVPKHQPETDLLSNCLNLELGDFPVEKQPKSSMKSCLKVVSRS